MATVTRTARLLDNDRCLPQTADALEPKIPFFQQFSTSASGEVWELYIYGIVYQVYRPPSYVYIKAYYYHIAYFQQSIVRQVAPSTSTVPGTIDNKQYAITNFKFPPVQAPSAAIFTVVLGGGVES